MNKTGRIVWGILLVALGVVLALNAFGLTSINLLFHGWWTLFIIIPCLAGLVSGRDITGNLIGLCIGTFLLLCCQDILSFSILWKLLFPVIIILFGIKLIFGNVLDRGCAAAIKRIRADHVELRSGTAVFSGEKLDFSAEVFQGAELNAVFGALTCDLTNALISQDCVIEASAIFGGIDILVPSGINVKTTSNSLFGGVSFKGGRSFDPSLPTLYIKGNCLFGGVEIK